MRTALKIVLGLIICAALFFYFFSSVRMRSPTSIGAPILSFPPDKKLNSVDEILKQLKFGNIVFNTPKKMNLHETSTIHLTLGLSQTIDELKERIQIAGIKESATIKISDRMEARLVGPNFIVSEITPAVQAVSAVDVTEWKWQIKPTSEGKQSLYLTLSAHISVNGAPTPRTIRTFDEIIEIEVTWQQRIEAFLGDNWEWFWAVILVPIFGWFWNHKKTSSIFKQNTENK